MGMKKSTALSLMYFAMAMSGNETGLDVFQGEPTPKRILPPQKPFKSFKEQDGIVNLIKELDLIQKGQSKKGKRKQERTIAKINEMIKNGYLTKDDFKT